MGKPSEVAMAKAKVGHTGVRPGWLHWGSPVPPTAAPAQPPGATLSLYEALYLKPESWEGGTQAPELRRDQALAAFRAGSGKST